MKALLFVQTGDARPKCEGRTGPLGEVPWTRCPAGLKAASAEYGLSLAQQRAVEAADLWWLVRCKNADEGRMIIGCCPLDDHRILASGSKDGAR